MNTSSHSVSTVYLLRHGALTQSGILCGHTDIPLSDKGWQQLKDATDALPNISQCYSSSLLRCSQFATQFTQQKNIPLVIDERLREMNFGLWDGKPYEKLWGAEQNPETQDLNKPHISQFWQDPWSCAPPQGESMLSFSARVEGFWQGFCQSLSPTQPSSSPQGNTLIISHGGVIKHLLANILKMPLPGNVHLNTLEVSYGAVVKISLFDDGDKVWPQVIFS